jgi:transcriptional regulator with XRE-family HTH domain
MTEDDKTPAKKGKATGRSLEIAKILFDLRERMQMSQKDFSNRIGVSFQQYQKYEKGKDRFSLERCLELCEALNVPLSIFENGISANSFGFAESGQEGFISSAVKHSAAEQELLEIYSAIPKKNKENFLAAVRQLAKMA